MEYSCWLSRINFIRTLGQHLFFGISAYTCGILQAKLHASPWLSFLYLIIIVLVLCIATSVLFRLSGLWFALGTFATIRIIYGISSYWKELTGGFAGLRIVYDPKFSNLMF